MFNNEDNIYRSNSGNSGNNLAPPKKNKRKGKGKRKVTTKITSSRTTSK